MKRLCLTICVTIFMLLLPIISHASCSIVIDGESLQCSDVNGVPIEPFVFEGTTYAPVRAVAEAFDITVGWDQETKTVFLGKKDGSPVLNEYINIFFNGKEFLCRDVNGRVVYPILKEGTTYLPIRGIGSLFDKSIYWDSLSQTATLTTNTTSTASNYLSDSIKNTAALSDISVNLEVNAAASMNGAIFSEKKNSDLVKYSRNGFSLVNILPDNYTENLSYIGNGKYFMVVPSTKFVSDQLLQEKLLNQQTPTEYSSLYIYIDTKGGYITDIKINFSGKAHYGGIVLDQAFSVTALLEYPDGFDFPITPYPDKPLGEDEESVSASTGENADSTMLTKLVKAYVNNLTEAQAKKLFEMVYVNDYTKEFSHKSSAQLNLEFKNISKALSSFFEQADGTFTLNSLVYINPSTLSYPADNAAKAEISIHFASEDGEWADTIDVIFAKKDNQWYLDISSALDLYQY